MSEFINLKSTFKIYQNLKFWHLRIYFLARILKLQSSEKYQNLNVQKSEAAPKNLAQPLIFSFTVG